MVDLLPTVLELADTEAHHTHFGRSLVPLLHDADAAHRDAAFCEGGFRTTDAHLLEAAGWIYEPKGRLQRERVELVGKATCIRTPEWTYVQRLSRHHRCHPVGRRSPLSRHRARLPLNRWATRNDGAPVHEAAFVAGAPEFGVRRFS